MIQYGSFKNVGSVAEVSELNSNKNNLLRPTQPPIQWVKRAFSLGVERLGREADHSVPSSVEINTRIYIYIFIPQIHLHGLVIS
jgi:hypothetical protein